MELLGMFMQHTLLCQAFDIRTSRISRSLIGLNRVTLTKVRSRSLCTCGNHNNLRIAGPIYMVLGPERSL